VTWSLFRWVWQLDGPLHVGMPPAGSLNRTRLYVPARAVWGALTAELARAEAGSTEPKYQIVGENLQVHHRFTYLFPAELQDGGWKAWLPTYRDGIGLAWRREDRVDDAVSDRAFRRRLLFTRPGTSIDPATDAADDGSLRETECVQDHWRDEHGREAGDVALVGYVFLRVAKAKDKYPPERRRLDAINTLFVGGDTRYGLGRMQRASLDLVSSAQVFDTQATLGADTPEVTSSAVFAHARADQGMTGAVELLGGWDRGSLRRLDQASPLWQPGSRSESPSTWKIEPDGTWSASP